MPACAFRGGCRARPAAASTALRDALGVALRGRPVTVFEAAELIGGAAAYSGGQVWVGANHVAEREGWTTTWSGRSEYVRDIARDHPEVLDEAATLRWLQATPRATRYWEEVERDPLDRSVAPRSLRGDGHPARALGRRATAAIPATVSRCCPAGAASDGYAYGPEYAMPHAIIVDAAGNRYCDDSYWVDIVDRTLDPGRPHLPFFLIWDEQHHRKYGLGATGPGEDYPEDS